MASSGSSSLQTCEEIQLTDQRKRKRMISNRESAKRSRMRKQKHLDDLTAQIAHLRDGNNQILTNMSIVAQLYINVESENSVLRGQMSELNHRLQALNDIINSMNSIGNDFDDFGDYDHMISGNHWSLTHFNQPIMASHDVLHRGGVVYTG